MGLHALRNMLECWAYAMALNELAHLASLKEYFLRFMGFMTTRYEPESGLRPPTILEAQSADKALMTLAFERVIDRNWSLDNALHEVTYIRAEMSSLMQPRPRLGKPTFDAKGDSGNKGSNKGKVGGKGKGPNSGKGKGFECSGSQKRLWMERNVSFACVSRQADVILLIANFTMDAPIRLQTIDHVERLTGPFHEQASH